MHQIVGKTYVLVSNAPGCVQPNILLADVGSTPCNLVAAADKLSLADAMELPEAHIDVVQQGEYVTLRSAAAGGLYLQARRKATRQLLFASHHRGVWEQWQVLSQNVQDPSCCTSPVMVVLASRQLPKVQLHVQLHPVELELQQPQPQIPPLLPQQSRSDPTPQKQLFAQPQRAPSEPRPFWSGPASHVQRLAHDQYAHHAEAVDDLLHLSQRLVVTFVARVRRLPLSKAFKQWRAATQRGGAGELRASQYRRDQLQCTAWSAWQEYIVHRRRKATSRQSVMSFSRYRSRCVQHETLLEWQVLAQHRRECRLQLLHLKRTRTCRLLHAALSEWHRVAAGRAHAQHMLVEHSRRRSRRMLADCFSAWRAHSEQSRHASTSFAATYQQRTVARAFTALQDHASIAITSRNQACSLLTSVHCAHTLSTTLRDWNCWAQARGRGRRLQLQLRALHHARTLSSCLREWQQLSQRMSVVRHTAAQLGVQASLKQLLRVLQAWQRVAFHRRQLHLKESCLSMLTHHRRLLAVVRAWTSAVRSANASTAMLQRISRRLVAAAFTGWRLYTALQPHDTSHSVSNCTWNLSYSLAISSPPPPPAYVTALWLQDMRASPAQQQQLLDLWISHCEQLQSAVRHHAAKMLRAWHRHASSQRPLRWAHTVICHRRAHNILRTTFTVWHQHTVTQLELHASAVPVRSRKLVEAAWSSWRMHVQHGIWLQGCMLQISAKHACRVQAQGLLCWHEAVARGHAKARAIGVATLHHRVMRQALVLQLWRHVTSRRCRARQTQAVLCRAQASRTARAVMHAWHRRARCAKAAATRSNELQAKLQATCWQALRQYAYNKRVWRGLMVVATGWKDSQLLGVAWIAMRQVTIAESQQVQRQRMLLHMLWEVRPLTLPAALPLLLNMTAAEAMTSAAARAAALVGGAAAAAAAAVGGAATVAAAAAAVPAMLAAGYARAQVNDSRRQVLMIWLTAAKHLAATALSGWHACARTSRHQEKQISEAIRRRALWQLHGCMTAWRQQRSLSRQREESAEVLRWRAAGKLLMIAFGGLQQLAANRRQSRGAAAFMALRKEQDLSRCVLQAWRAVQVRRTAMRVKLLQHQKQVAEEVFVTWRQLTMQLLEARAVVEGIAIRRRLHMQEAVLHLWRQQAVTSMERYQPLARFVQQRHAERLLAWAMREWHLLTLRMQQQRREFPAMCRAFYLWLGLVQDRRPSANSASPPIFTISGAAPLSLIQSKIHRKGFSPDNSAAALVQPPGSESAVATPDGGGSDHLRSTRSSSSSARHGAGGSAPHTCSSGTGSSSMLDGCSATVRLIGRTSHSGTACAATRNDRKDNPIETTPSTPHRHVSTIPWQTPAPDSSPNVSSPVLVASHKVEHGSDINGQGTGVNEASAGGRLHTATASFNHAFSPSWASTASPESMGLGDSVAVQSLTASPIAMHSGGAPQQTSTFDNGTTPRCKQLFGLVSAPASALPGQQAASEIGPLTSPSSGSMGPGGSQAAHSHMVFPNAMHSVGAPQQTSALNHGTTPRRKQLYGSVSAPSSTFTGQQAAAIPAPQMSHAAGAPRSLPRLAGSRSSRNPMALDAIDRLRKESLPAFSNPMLGRPSGLDEGHSEQWRQTSPLQTQSTSSSLHELHWAADQQPVLNHVHPQLLQQPPTAPNHAAALAAVTEALRHLGHHQHLSTRVAFTTAAPCLQDTQATALAAMLRTQPALPDQHPWQFAPEHAAAAPDDVQLHACYENMLSKCAALERVLASSQATAIPEKLASSPDELPSHTSWQQQDSILARDMPPSHMSWQHQNSTPAQGATAQLSLPRQLDTLPEHIKEDLFGSLSPFQASPSHSSQSEGDGQQERPCVWSSVAKPPISHRCGSI